VEGQGKEYSGTTSNPMTLTFTLLALTFIVSFGALLLNLVTAPEGYEDETGFHVGSKGKPNPFISRLVDQPKMVPVRAKVATPQVAA